MSSIMMHVWPNDTHPLSLSSGPMGDISVHASIAAHDTTLDKIVTFAAGDTSLKISYPSRRAIRSSKWYILLPQSCLKYNANDMLKWKGGDNHFDNKTQFTTRNITPTNKQQVSKSFSTPRKEIHEFHTLNKGLEIHLPQIVEQFTSELESSPFFEVPIQSNLFK